MLPSDKNHPLRHGGEAISMQNHLIHPRSLGGRRISVQTAEKSVSFVDTSSANSYGYWLVGITKRSSIFDGLPSKPSAAQTPRVPSPT
jgi:hypothetical protein